MYAGTCLIEFKAVIAQKQDYTPRKAGSLKDRQTTISITPRVLLEYVEDTSRGGGDDAKIWF